MTRFLVYLLIRILVVILLVIVAIAATALLFGDGFVESVLNKIVSTVNSLFK